MCTRFALSEKASAFVKQKAAVGSQARLADRLSGELAAPRRVRVSRIHATLPVTSSRADTAR
jgi:hypothetical protein